jgi:hypothetical protein
LNDALQRRLPTGVADTQNLRGCHHDQRRIDDRGEIDEPHTILKVLQECGAKR